MAWCHQAPSHYLSQCWTRSLSPYGVTRPQWVKPRKDTDSLWSIGFYFEYFANRTSIIKYEHRNIIPVTNYLFFFHILMSHYSNSIYQCNVISVVNQYMCIEKQHKFFCNRFLCSLVPQWQYHFLDQFCITRDSVKFPFTVQHKFSAFCVALFCLVISVFKKSYSQDFFVKFFRIIWLPLRQLHDSPIVPQLPQWQWCNHVQNLCKIFHNKIQQSMDIQTILQYSSYQL